MRTRLAALLISLAVAAGTAACGEKDEPAADATASPDAVVASDEPAQEDAHVLSGTQPLLNGEPQRLEEFQGDVVLVVNTASECGFTPQFEGLERLYESKRDAGLVVLGFPADDVASQEPRSDEEIAEFCEENFGVSFPMFAKSNVVAAPVNPLFERLAADAGAPSWNFNKYLLDREGAVVERFDHSVEPDDPALGERIDELLASRS